MMTNEEFGRSVRRARKKHGVRQMQISHRTGLSQPCISAVENGRHKPRLDTVQLLAEGIGCTVGELLGEERCE